MEIIIKQDNQSVAEAFASFFAEWLRETKKETVSVALSGGSTPKALFQHWAEHYQDKIDWRRIHFFWGDERCVPPDDPDSNFGMTKALLFDHIDIPTENIHRARGEAFPEKEAERYGREIMQGTERKNGQPVFDLVILGMGADGHTASIFPDQMDLLRDNRICAVATHPESGQERITLTGPVINAARQVVFLITGSAKAEVLKEVMARSEAGKAFPAAHIQPENDELCWFLDESATNAI